MSHPNSKVWNGLIDDAFALDQENPFLGQTEDYTQKKSGKKSELKANIEDRLDEIESEKALKGGRGSGNFGHHGRPGQRGGSSSDTFSEDMASVNSRIREAKLERRDIATRQAAEAKVSADAKVAKDKQEYEYAVSTIGREKDQGFTRDYGAAHRKLVKEGFKHTGFRDRGTGMYSQTIHSYEHPDGRQETVTVELRRRKAVKAEEGVWRTIRGSRVFIEDGKITKGPENLVGKKQGWTGDPKDNPAKSDNSDEIAHDVTVTIYDSGRGSNVDSHFRSMDSLTDKEGPGSLETMHVKTSSSALAKATRIARAIGLDEVTVHFESSRGRTKTMKVKVPETGDIPRPDFSQVDYKD